MKIKSWIIENKELNISSIQKDNAEKEASQAEDKLATTLYTLQVDYIFQKKDENLESRFILDFYKGLP